VRDPVGELLGEGAAPRVAENVDRLPAEDLDHAGGETGHLGHTQREANRAGATHPRRIEADDLKPGEVALERAPHVKAAAEAREEEQRLAGTLHRHPQAGGRHLDDLLARYPRGPGAAPPRWPDSQPDRSHGRGTERPPRHLHAAPERPPATDKCEI
jgi:hypothetical protein